MSKIFFLIIFSYLIYFILIPPFQIPDEPEHLENIYWISRLKYPVLPKIGEKRPGLFVDQIINVYDWNKVNSDGFVLSNFQKIQAFNKNSSVSFAANKFSGKSSQAYHPPLYFAGGALIFRLAEILKVNLITQYYLVRLTSFLFYSASVYVAYLILKKFFGTETVSNSLLVFFAINPTVLKMGIGINNEIAAVFFSLLFLYFILKTAGDSKIAPTKTFLNKNILLVSIMSAGAILSKFSGIFTVLAFTVFSFFRLRLSKKFFLTILKFTAVLSVFLLPWFVFNFLRYGNPLQDNFALICKRDFPSYNIITTTLWSLFEFRHTINHYAGFLGWGEPMPFKWFFVSYTVVFTVLFLLGLISFMRRTGKTKIIFLSYTFSLFFFLFLLDFYRKLQNYSCDIQGRYLLPAFLPIIIILAFGLAKLLKINIEKASLLLMYFALFQYYFVLVFVLLPYYYV